MAVSPRQSRSISSKWPRMMLVVLAAFIILTPFFNYFVMTKTTMTSTGRRQSTEVDENFLMMRNAELEARVKKMEALIQAQTTSSYNDKYAPPLPSSEGSGNNIIAIDSPKSSSSPLLTKAMSINSYWWPSTQSGGSLLGKIYKKQNPPDCSSLSTRYFVWLSKPSSEKDSRGLTAWAHAGSSHLLHALTDGDDLTHGSRILVNDDKLWPMAKGCREGPETRECYFEPLSRCTMADADAMHSSNATVLAAVKDDYDRKLRTLYSTRQLWFRVTEKKFSWTLLPGTDKDHNSIFMIASALAYYFRPKPWLRDEIDKRIRNSIPTDLNPERTVGVPIRRSDKCLGHNITGSARGELDCPAIAYYLEGVKKFVEFDPLIENVIVTSEDKSACDEFLEMMKEELPTLRVVLNVGDVQQGTGSGSKLESYVEGSANANVVASALTSMHLHLRARYFVITSKSTWTSTISVMARVYGFASDVFVIDIKGRSANTLMLYARSGCPAQGMSSG